MNKKILSLVSTILFTVMLIGPVIAIGPTNPTAIEKNENLVIVEGHIGAKNYRGEASGTLASWYTSGGFWEKWKFFDAREGSGKLNNAIEGNFATFGQYSSDKDDFEIGEPTVNENKWIYMSPEGSGVQIPSPFGTHGMIWWLYFLSYADENDPSTLPYALSKANEMANTYPEGAYWSYDFVE
jgi:hypothetical protein